MMNGKEEKPLFEGEELIKGLQPIFNILKLVTQQIGPSPTSSFNSFLPGNYVKDFMQAIHQAGINFHEKIIEDGAILHKLSYLNHWMTQFSPFFLGVMPSSQVSRSQTTNS